MEHSPFSPYSSTLQEILRRRFINRVARWLLGNDERSILAQQSGSVWESALTVIFLSKSRQIFEHCGEEQELQTQIKAKSADVARWLLTKKRVAPRGESTYYCWEGVTWDTAVVIRSLLIVLKDYPNEFSAEKTDEILNVILKAVGWLHCRFNEWETDVKYPFGPADIAQIVITMLCVREDYPEIYNAVTVEFYGDQVDRDLCSEIVKYLLHIKTNRSITVPVSARETQDIITCWWDDYFTTAEVVESLALYHVYCESSPFLKRTHDQLLKAIKIAITESCTYFEQNQVDGTWGSHIDTIKVIHAYVMIRKIEPQDLEARYREDWLVTPEIHTTFKALRWICDEKQIFSDGSFLHTMFLTIFYSLALVEVYNSWEPAKCTIEKIYDDVVWSCPVRTTPERSKRLKMSLKNRKLREDLDRVSLTIDRYRKIFSTALLLIIAAPVFLFIGKATERLQYSYEFSIPDERGDFFGYAGTFGAILLATITYIWQEKFKLRRRKRKTESNP